VQICKALTEAAQHNMLLLLLLQQLLQDYRRLH
jgi:hypothetical protein